MAEDMNSGLKAFSQTMTLEVLGNLHTPTLKMPSNIEMLSNETKIINLDKAEDKDAQDYPEITQFEIVSSSSLGSKFITYSNETRTVTIYPKSEDTYAGDYTLRFKVDDFRDKSKYYSFKVKIKPVKKFVPVFKILEKEEEEEIKEDISTEETTEEDEVENGGIVEPKKEEKLSTGFSWQASGGSRTVAVSCKASWLNLNSELVVVFSEKLKLSKMNLEVVSAIGFYLKVLPNENLIETYSEDKKMLDMIQKRDLSIKNMTISALNSTSLTVKLHFSSIKDVSIGGKELEDLLSIQVANPDVFKFEE